MLYFILRVPTDFRWVFFQLLRMVTLRREQGRELRRGPMVVSRGYEGIGSGKKY